MATIYQVALAVKDATLALLQTKWADFPPAQIGIGWPYAPALSEILGEGGVQVSIFPLTRASQNRTGFKPRWVPIASPAVELEASVFSPVGREFPQQLMVPLQSWNLFFYGEVAAGLNIHVFLSSGNIPITDFYYQTVDGDTVISIAANIATLIAAQASDWPDLTVDAAGNSISFQGISSLQCNIGGTTTMAMEVRRTMTPVQVSVWAPNADLRNQIGELIENGLGTAFPNPFLRAEDGSAVWIRLRGAPSWEGDVAQSSYSLYQWHGVFECEYPTLMTAQATQIESIGATI